jgi:hypothetical protein
MLDAIDIGQGGGDEDAAGVGHGLRFGSVSDYARQIRPASHRPQWPQNKPARQRSARAGYR